MLNKRLLLAGMLACMGVTAALPTAQAQEKKANFGKSAFKDYRSLPANKKAVDATIKKIKAAFPGWAVVTDKVDGSFIDIYGRGIPLPGATNAARAQQCLAEQLSVLGLVSTEWVQGKSISGPRADYVNYTRKIDGHAVAFSNLTFRFSKNGELMRIQMQHYGQPVVKAPSMAVADAKAAALADVRDFKNVTISGAVIEPGWSWFPIPVADGYELRPAYAFQVNGKEQDGLPLKLKGYIDGVNGNVLYRYNQVKDAFDVTIKGTVYKAGITNPATLEPLPNLEIQVGAGTYHTDTAGVYANASLSVPAATTIPLQGKWSIVVDDPTGLTPIATNLVSALGTTYTFPPAAPASSRHINAYYHVNKVHDVMNRLLPGFTDLDFPLPTNVDLHSGTCNAYYSGSDINFFAAGGGCVSFADMGDVVYHEYGHGISDMFYTWVTGGTTLMNSALHEGNSDVWGLGITKYPVMAENAFAGGGYIRAYNIIPSVYPIDCAEEEPHKNGQTIAGSWWDVGQAIGNIDTMMKIFASVYYDHPNYPDGMEGVLYQEILLDAVMNDDNDGNVFNGTPHYNALIKGFARHGVYVLGDAMIGHTELPNQPAGVPIHIGASLLAGNYDFYHDMSLRYRINSGSWTTVALDIVTTQATIPAQEAGNVIEYYFIVHDSVGQDIAYFPLACNPNLPFAWANTPYQFAVGVGVVDSQNFDAATPGWSIANNTGDNASSRKWVQMSPGGTWDMWPAGDHTGGGSCLGTGDEIDSTGVRSGTSTVLSPTYDISDLNEPVVAYYRWLSNEKGYRNPKNDPWIVRMRNVTTNSWQTVESTYQGELTWRRRVFRVRDYFPSGVTSVQFRFLASDSVITTLRSNGQSKSVNCMDDFYIYDKLAVGVKDKEPVTASVFPIPAGNQVQVTLPTGRAGSIKIYNMAGQLVSETVMLQSSTKYIISTAALPSGQYNMVIQTKSAIQTKKIVVVHE